MRAQFRGLFGSRQSCSPVRACLKLAPAMHHSFQVASCLLQAVFLACFDEAASEPSHGSISSSALHSIDAALSATPCNLDGAHALLAAGSVVRDGPATHDSTGNDIKGIRGDAGKTVRPDTSPGALKSCALPTCQPAGGGLWDFRDVSMLAGVALPFMLIPRAGSPMGPDIQPGSLGCSLAGQA